MIAFASSMSTISSGRCGIEAPKATTGVGSRGTVSSGLPSRTQRSYPPSRIRTSRTPAYVRIRSARVAAIWPARRPGHFSFGVALRVPAVEDHGGVCRDAERPDGLVELRRRAAVPVGRVLQPVRVQVEGAGQMALRILVGHAEVHVEEECGTVGRRLRALAVQDRAKPGGMDQLAVAGERLGRPVRIVQPGGPAARELADPLEAVRAEPIGDPPRVPRRRAVDDDRSVREDAVRGESLDDLAAVERLEPRGGKRGGPRDVAARHAIHGPAVVGDQGPDVDDGEPARGERSPERVRRDGLVRPGFGAVGTGVGDRGDGHGLPSELFTGVDREGDGAL